MAALETTLYSFSAISPLIGVITTSTVRQQKPGVDPGGGRFSP